MLRRGTNTLVYVCFTTLLLVAALFVYRDHPLVVLTSDHPNQALLFPSFNLAPGTSSAVTDTLSNRGLLPLNYSLQVSSPSGEPIPPAYRLRIERLPDSVVLFNGPLPRDTAPLGSLSPNQSVSLALTLSLPRDPTAMHLPADLSFTWRGQAGVSSSLLLPLFEVFLVMAVVAIAGRWLIESRWTPAAGSNPAPPAQRRDAEVELSRQPGP